MDTGVPGVPPDLPDHLRRPVIDLDPDQDATGRQWDAYVSFVAYHRDLFAWLRVNAPEYRAHDVLRALGVTMDDMFRVARELPT
ncbi:hypothetical protein [Pseudonocardia sp. NPDC046786]|uniref:hypothetical protein n=1 Tax=Pseudonocardia sp. NPDC046786 TaxID=3155471 RepID=UPI0033D2A67D